MHSLALLLLSPLLWRLCSGANCVYTDSKSGQKLYLDALAHSELKATSSQTHDQHTYTFTPCRNAAGHCPDSSGSGGVNTAMCRQTLHSDAGVCIVVAVWDASVQPSFSASGGGQWDFTYSNGDTSGCSGGNARRFYVHLNCSMTAGDFKVISAGERGEDCTYEFNIDTRWACKGQVYSASDGLSGGSTFLIILASVVFSYFCFGWCICAYRNREDGGFTDITGNIPHLTFWSTLPAWVYAGCCFTKDFVNGLRAKNRDSTGNEDVGYEKQIDD